jgi:hypothetical protein
MVPSEPGSWPDPNIYYKLKVTRYDLGLEPLLEHPTSSFLNSHTYELLEHIKAAQWPQLVQATRKIPPQIWELPRIFQYSLDPLSPTRLTLSEQNIENEYLERSLF